MGKAKRLAAKAMRKTAVRPMGGDAKVKKALAAVDKMQGGSGGIFVFRVAGDTVAGELLAMKSERGKFGDQLRVTLRTPDGVQTVFANKSLERGLEDSKAKVGDTVAIQFKESVNTGKGRPFRVFAVAKA